MKYIYAYMYTHRYIYMYVFRYTNVGGISVNLHGLQILITLLTYIAAASIRVQMQILQCVFSCMPIVYSCILRKRWYAMMVYYLIGNTHIKATFLYRVWCSAATNYISQHSPVVFLVLLPTL